ncbi:MAG: hypothetical protein QOJ97_102 [Solirubrobacteraceae bacterium]|jgi:hypothetical protein|nr:hypothetical protein [Solirubrobacteraceae bacterium]
MDEHEAHEVGRLTSAALRHLVVYIRDLVADFDRGEARLDAEGMSGLRAVLGEALASRLLAFPAIADRSSDDSALITELRREADAAPTEVESEFLNTTALLVEAEALTVDALRRVERKGEFGND